MRGDLVKLCKEVAMDREPVCASMYGSRVCGYAREDSDYDILLVLDEYADGVRYHLGRLRDRWAAVLVADRDLFELDIQKGVLGDFVAERVMAPYLPLVGSAYLEEMEISAKRRVAKEEIEDLVIEYGEMSRGLVVTPEYLALSRMRKRSRVYPPVRYSYSNMLRNDLKERNLAEMSKGYRVVLGLLVEEGIGRMQDENLVLENKYVDLVLARKTVERVVNITELSRRALSSYLAHGRAGQASLEFIARELASRIRRELQSPLPKLEMEDPKNYLFVKTSLGLASLNERVSISEFAGRLRPNATIVVSPLSGVLNEVYLVTAGEEKLVAKKFIEWHGFKWFILNLFALGSRVFSVAGKTRLSNEYGVNKFLADNGISVPEIVYLSLPDRILFEEFLDGFPLSELARTIAFREYTTRNERKIVKDVGRKIAQIHLLDIALGDCKPENFIFGKDGELYCLDLEQAGKGGDKSWDIAEFLYYSGHYGSTMTGGLRQFARGFTEGYLELGNMSIMRKAAGINYAKSFSFWTPATVIHGISEILRTPVLE